MNRKQPTPPPPPAGPPAGWYPEPSGSPGLRWWDGSGWTEYRQPSPPTSTPGAPGSTGPAPVGPGPEAIVVPRPLTPVGEWLPASFRLAVRQAGHLLPIIVLTIVPGFLALSTAIWYGLYDVVMVSDRVRGTITFEGEPSPLLVLAAVGGVVMILLLHLLYASACQRFRALIVDGDGAGSDAVETGYRDATGEAGSVDPASVAPPWRSALGRGFLRWPPVSVSLLIRLGLVGGSFVLMSILTAASPLFVLLFLLWPVLAVTAWVRLSLVGVVAAVGDGGRGRPVGASLTAGLLLTRFRFWSLLGRLLALAVIGASVLFLGNVIGGLFSAIAGGQPPGTVDPFAERIAFNQVLPTNPASFALNWLFLAFGAGAWQVLSAAGHSLLYADLDGSRIDDSVHH